MFQGRPSWPLNLRCSAGLLLRRNHLHRTGNLEAIKDAGRLLGPVTARLGWLTHVEMGFIGTGTSNRLGLSRAAGGPGHTSTGPIKGGVRLSPLPTSSSQVQPDQKPSPHLVQGLTVASQPLRAMRTLPNCSALLSQHKGSVLTCK